MKEPGHYSTHCQDDLAWCAALCRRDGQEKDAQVLIAIASILREAPKFRVDGYEMFDEMIKAGGAAELPHALRLPYPTVVIESAVDTSVQSRDSALFDKTIIIATEMEERREGAISVMGVSHVDLSTANVVGTSGRSYAFPKNEWMWVPIWICAVIERTDEPPPPSVPNSVRGVRVQVSQMLRTYGPPPEVFKNKDSQYFAHDILTEVQTTLGFLWALEQRRATVTRYPAPEALNRKRARKGALPFDEYHILELEPPRREGSEGGCFSVDDRRSPREHQRSGHWRHFKSGKRTWVRPSIVNAGIGGAIWKDYQVLSSNKPKAKGEHR